MGYILKLRLFLFREREGGKGGSDWLVKGIGLFVDLKGEANYSKNIPCPKEGHVCI